MSRWNWTAFVSPGEEGESLRTSNWILGEIDRPRERSFELLNCKDKYHMEKQKGTVCPMKLTSLTIFHKHSPNSVYLYVLFVKNQKWFAQMWYRPIIQLCTKSFFFFFFFFFFFDFRKGDYYGVRYSGPKGSDFFSFLMRVMVCWLLDCAYIEGCEWGKEVEMINLSFMAFCSHTSSQGKPPESSQGVIYSFIFFCCILTW